MDFLAKPEFLWLIITIVLFTIEALTVNLTTIWFGFGAIVAMVAASLGGSMQFQVVLFILTTIVLLIFTRPLAVKYIKKTSTNIDGLVGKQAIVTERIDNLAGTGQVKIDGNVWSARSENGFIIEEREVVDIIKISGVKLIVKMKGM
ncbi:MAG: NfeD family protein [Monoglobales bacterium]